MIGGLVFFLWLVKRATSVKFHFQNRRQNGRAAHFESRYFFFYNLSTQFIQLIWLRLNCCLMLIFFRPTQKVESMKITAWKPFLGQKTQMKKMAKNGKIDLCSANHRICNIRYFLIKFSGYIAYDMQFNFLYCFIKPFIYEYLIFTFISDDFLRNSQNMGENGENTPSWWARQAQVVRDICLKFGHYRHQNKGFKDKGLRFWCIFIMFMKEMKLMITF